MQTARNGAAFETVQMTKAIGWSAQPMVFRYDPAMTVAALKEQVSASDGGADKSRFRLAIGGRELAREGQTAARLASRQGRPRHPREGGRQSKKMLQDIQKHLFAHDDSRGVMGTPFPYTPNPANVPRFLAHLRSAGVPSRVTQEHLASVGFKSSNDRYLISVLRFIGFIDGSGAPTDAWRAFRDKAGGPRVLARQLKACYDDLYEAFPDAHERPVEVLRNFFSTKNDASEITITRMVTTFRNMAGEAEFDEKGADDLNERSHAAPLARVEATSTTGRPVQVYEAPGLLIRIDPTPENVERGLKFLRIFQDEK